MPTLGSNKANIILRNHHNESLKLGKANRCFTLEIKSIMISIQYFVIIYIAFDNLTLGLNASDTIATIVIKNILRQADLHLKQIIGRDNIC